jgi:hypothetical protein
MTTAMLSLDTPELLRRLGVRVEEDPHVTWGLRPRKVALTAEDTLMAIVKHAREERAIVQAEMARVRAEQATVTVDREAIKAIVLGEPDKAKPVGFFGKARRFLSKVFGRRRVEPREDPLAVFKEVPEQMRRRGVPAIERVKAKPTRWSSEEARARSLSMGERIIGMAEGNYDDLFG